MRIADVHVSLSTGYPRSDLIDLALATEQLGFGGLWLTELAGYDAFSLLTQIALKTQRIELGTGIVNDFGRSPFTLAQAAASLSDTLGGRAVNLGLGASSRVVIERLHGVAFDRPFTRMAETLQFIRLALSGERLDFEGQLFRTRGFTLGVRPAGPVHLYVGGLAEPMLRVVGECADGWLAILPSRQAFSHVRADVAAAAERASRPMPRTAAYIYTCVGTGVASAEDALRRTIAFYMTSSGAGYQRLFRRYGYSRIVDGAVALWSEGKRAEARALVDSDTIRDLCLVGAPTDVPAQLQAFVDAGINTPVIRFPDPLEPERQVSMLREIASQLESD
jgi:probable F420-dependent oxidoreductase